MFNASESSRMFLPKMVGAGHGRAPVLKEVRLDDCPPELRHVPEPDFK